jgi:hypothetical protein
MREIFKDKALEAEITAKGYTIIKQLLNAEAIVQLTACYNTYAGIDDRAFTISNWNNNTEYRTQSHNAIINTVLPLATAYLKDYVPSLGVFTAKKPGANSDMLVHQDWSLVDETKYRSVSFWVALVDMDRSNGNLQVMEGSHLVAGMPRGQNMPVPFIEIESYLKNECATDLHLKAGDAVVFEHRLIHCSPPNVTDKLRLAAVLALVPKEAEFIHYFYNPAEPEELEVLKMDRENFYLIDFFNYPAKPDNLGVIKKIPYSPIKLGAEDFAPLTDTVK